MTLIFYRRKLTMAKTLRDIMQALRKYDKHKNDFTLIGEIKYGQRFKLTKNSPTNVILEAIEEAIDWGKWLHGEREPGIAVRLLQATRRVQVAMKPRFNLERELVQGCKGLDALTDQFEAYKKRQGITDKDIQAYKNSQHASNGNNQQRTTTQPERKCVIQ